MNPRRTRPLIILLAVLVLLLIPLIAMQFTDEVNWGSMDFLVMGALLSLVGLGIELVLRRVVRPRHRLLLVLAIVGLFLLVWAELAVGIFDV